MAHRARLVLSVCGKVVVVGGGWRPCAPPEVGDEYFDLLFASSIAASLRFFALETIGPPGVELGVYGLPLIG